MRLSHDLGTYYREVADHYRQETGQTEYELCDVVMWAMNNNELEMSPSEEREFHMLRLREALRSDTITDEKGRKVRVRHCVIALGDPDEDDEDGKPKQRTFWAHIDDADPEFLRKSLFDRRDRVKTDVDSLKADLDYINARRVAGGLKPIQMSFNF